MLKTKYTNADDARPPRLETEPIAPVQPSWYRLIVRWRGSWSLISTPPVYAAPSMTSGRKSLQARDIECKRSLQRRGGPKVLRELGLSDLRTTRKIDAGNTTTFRVRLEALNGPASMFPALMPAITLLAVGLNPDSKPTIAGGAPPANIFDFHILSYSVGKWSNRSPSRPNDRYIYDIH